MTHEHDVGPVAASTDMREPRVAPTGPADGSHIMQGLALGGRRLTGPRQLIASFVAPRRDHFSAQEVWEELRSDHHGIGRSTVFRTLELLVELGALDRVLSGDGAHRYAACETRHHHHLVCLDCSTVSVAASSAIEEQIHSLAEAAGFELLTHHLELIGRCAACRTRHARPADASSRPGDTRDA